jgi:methionyl-tRNA synthetase
MLGKGILRFHCVFWPAMLLSAGYDVPQQLFAHGHLLMGEQKMSKSLGNVIDPFPLVDVYGVDAVRYWAIRAATFGRDGAASEESLHERYERELANELGNLVSRTTAMIARYRNGDLPAGPGSTEIAARLDSLHAEIPPRLDAWELTAVLESIWDSVRELNRLVERSKPWELAKDDARRAELDTVLYDLADGLRSVAVALHAYLPVITVAILGALGQSPDVGWDGVRAGGLVSTGGIEPAPPLFPRVERIAA